MSPFRAIAARWLPLARKAAGLADVPASAFGRAWDKGTLRDRRMLATIARVPIPEDVAALPWLKIPAALRQVIMLRAREMQEWLGAFCAEPEGEEAGQ
ncbi:hypothetical protein GCM10007933_22060 [Zoogloea oryzae]|uniref:Uncharacterized protein n=1 Tax=Zoogloea oryzae TaxID=310767 RepID=A0ABQ6FBT5_9RHOO|nr:hypothetical protein [Zoogloea oryzae]GLT22746.1 hypothetical protein GCM10007933_22060 [Zoogloea oryzae]